MCLWHLTQTMRLTVHFFTIVMWNWLIFYLNYFLDTEIPWKIKQTLSHHSLVPSLAAEMCIWLCFVPSEVSNESSCELNLTALNIKFFCPHFQWWFAIQIIGLVTHSTITMVTKWRRVCFTSSVKCILVLHSGPLPLPTSQRALKDQ